MALKLLDINIKEEFMQTIFKNKSITTLFQPIISLSNDEILGYEALSRGPQNTCYYSPQDLFAFAKEINKVWELDFLCRLKAIEGAQKIIKDKLLFINVDVNIIKDPKFRKGFTKKFLKNNYIPSNRIIFEITEHTAITDYKLFNEVFENYRNQGYRIAIDDAGDGYSGLRLMTEIRPDFLKLDMSLIRNIDKDMLKKELIKSFYKFSSIANIELIAEGIETYDELKTLIEIGINYGQGYYIQKPKETFDPLSPEIIEQIKKINNHKKQIIQNPHTLTVGMLARQDKPLEASNNCKKIEEIFSQFYHLQGITIVDNNKPLGLVMRHKFYCQLKKYEYIDKFLLQPVTKVMDPYPLILDYSHNIKEAANIAMSREETRVYDYIIIAKQGKYIGVLPIAYLLNAFSEILS